MSRRPRICSMAGRIARQCLIRRRQLHGLFIATKSGIALTWEWLCLSVALQVCEVKLSIVTDDAAQLLPEWSCQRYFSSAVMLW